jgi:hypothetical protein
MSHRVAHLLGASPAPASPTRSRGTQNPSVTGTQAFVEFSNFTLTFGMGSSPSANARGPHESNDCKIAIVD